MDTFKIQLAAVALIAAGLFALTTPQAAHAQFGISVGANFDNLSDIDTGDRQATFDNATGFHAGVFYNLSFGPISFRPGLVYVDVGEINYDAPQFGVGFEQTEDQHTVQQRIDLSLIEAPLDFRYRLATPLVSPYALAGPVLRLANPDDTSYDQFSLGGAVGAGIEVSLPGTGVRLYPEARFQFGISRLVDDFEAFGAEFTAENDVNLRTFMLRLGISL